ncbi:nitrogen assimilation transcription factor nirA [Colletotrichum asianum]
MARRLEAKPGLEMNKNLRPSRECIREACENCREKKAKCNGAIPCQRCVSKRLGCRYEPRRARSKRSLQAEINALKDAQCHKDAVIAALSVPGQSMDVLQRLWAGEPLQSIYESVRYRERSFEPMGSAADESQVPLVSAEPPPNVSTDSSSSTPTQALSSPHPSLKHTENAMFENWGTSGHGEEMSCDTKLASVSFAGQNDSSLHSYQGFADWAYDETSMGDWSNFGAVSLDSHPNIPFGDLTTIPHFDASSQHFQNELSANDPDCSRKPSSSAQDNQTSFSNCSSIESMLWSGSGDVSSPSSDHSRTHPIPSPIVSPITISSTESRPASRDVVHKPLGKNPFRPPLRKQTPNGEVPLQPQADKQTMDKKTLFSRAPSVAEDGMQASREQSAYLSDSSQSRKRHRTASARSYRKQKEQIEFMQTVKIDVEIRNEELKKEHAQLWHEVIAAKNALMGHADCKHPTINAWVQAEAASFVRDGVNGHGHKAGAWPIGRHD